MSYAYMIKSIEYVNGVPVFPGAHHVTPQIYGYYVAYKLVGRRFSTLAVLYREPVTGQTLVGAEQAILDTIPGGETLNETVAVNPADWGCWKCDTVGLDQYGEPQLLNGVITFTTEILLTTCQMEMAVLAPTLMAVGGAPSAPFSLGLFLVEDIDATSIWIGDHNV